MGLDNNKLNQDNEQTGFNLMVFLAVFNEVMKSTRNGLQINKSLTWKTLPKLVSITIFLDIKMPKFQIFLHAKYHQFNSLI